MDVEPQIRNARGDHPDQLRLGTTRRAPDALIQDKHWRATNLVAADIDFRRFFKVDAFAAGRIVDLLTAKSQLMGGQIWGVSSALHEATEIDRKRARYNNNDIAEYLIPVNADIGEAEVILIPEEDHLVNGIGIKGLGELGNVGTNAAVANAVYHTTGVRIRDLPIRLENLLGAPSIES